MADKTQLQIDWNVKDLQLRYFLSDLCLFSVRFRGKAYRCPFDPPASHNLEIDHLSTFLSEDVDFVAFNDLRIGQPIPRIRSLPSGVLYCLNQTQNYFIDLHGSFENYLQSLSSKTRSTLKRKVKRFAELSGGRVDFRVYRSEGQLREYHRIARSVACRTYQEKLFQGALPDSEGFCRQMLDLASSNQVRGFLLFLNERPVAYLYMPLSEGVAEYAYLGYDPDFAEHSPGTVLLYLAIEEFFREPNVKYFNFGYGTSQTKTTFSTSQFLRADVYLFHKSPRNWMSLYGHTGMDAFSETCGRTLDRIGLRRAVKRWLRSA